MTFLLERTRDGVFAISSPYDATIERAAGVAANRNGVLRATQHPGYPRKEASHD
jgi:hypothetical protein